MRLGGKGGSFQGGKLFSLLFFPLPLVLRVVNRGEGFYDLLLQDFPISFKEVLEFKFFLLFGFCHNTPPAWFFWQEADHTTSRQGGNGAVSPLPGWD